MKEYFDEIEKMIDEINATVNKIRNGAAEKEEEDRLELEGYKEQCEILVEKIIALEAEKEELINKVKRLENMTKKQRRIKWKK